MTAGLSPLFVVPLLPPAWTFSFGDEKGSSLGCYLFGRVLSPGLYFSPLPA